MPPRPSPIAKTRARIRPQRIARYYTTGPRPIRWIRFRDLLQCSRSPAAWRRSAQVSYVTQFEFKISFLCHSERSNSTEGRIAESKNLREFTLQPNHTRSFDSVLSSFVGKKPRGHPAQDDILDKVKIKSSHHPNFISS